MNDGDQDISHADIVRLVIALSRDIYVAHVDHGVARCSLLHAMNLAAQIVGMAQSAQVDRIIEEARLRPQATLNTIEQQRLAHNGEAELVQTNRISQLTSALEQNRARDAQSQET